MPLVIESIGTSSTSTPGHKNCHLPKLVAVEPQLSPVGTKIPVNQIVAESIIACRYRRVRREKRVCSNYLAGLVEAQARGNQFPASLQVEKSGVSFIDMPRGW